MNQWPIEQSCHDLGCERLPAMGGFAFAWQSDPMNTTIVIYVHDVLGQDCIDDFAVVEPRGLHGASFF